MKSERFIGLKPYIDFRSPADRNAWERRQPPQVIDFSALLDGEIRTPAGSDGDPNPCGRRQDRPAFFKRKETA